MRREVFANGAPGHIETEENRMRYTREGAETISAEFEVVALEPGSYWVRLNGNSYRVMLGGSGEVSANGRKFSIEVFDPRDLRSTARGNANQGRYEVVSPMPGKIVRIIASVGDTVEEGDGLVVVEAMKMQNEMKSPRNGKIVEIRARQDATVGAGEVLLVIE